MKLRHKLTLDLVQRITPPVLHLKQGDCMTREVLISLTNDGAPWFPKKEDLIFQIVYCKTDNTGGCYDTLPDGTVACTAEDHSVLVQLHPQMLTAPGLVICELRILDGCGAQVSTFAFFLSVEHSVSAGIKSEDYYHFTSLDALRQAIGEMSQLETEEKSSLVAAVNELSRGVTVKDAVLCSPQTLSAEAQTQVRQNISASPVNHGHSYNDLADKPIIPDSLPANGGNADTVGGMTVDAIKNDANAFLVAELAKRGQLKPEFANSVEECVDESKLYVLPDGYIWAYMYGGASGPSYTNLAGNVLTDTRLSSKGVATSCAGAVTTGFIPCKVGQVIRVQGFDPTVLIDDSTNPYICFFTAAAESAIVSDTTYTRPNLLYGSPGGITKEGDAYCYTAFTCGSGGTDVKPHPLQDSITHIRICGKAIEGAEIIVTVDQEITEGTGAGYAWRNTGHAFVPADYEDRIVALEKKVLENKVPENHEGRFAALEKPWKGLKWVCLGDSLTYTNERATKRYYDYIAEKTGIAVVNMGDGGTGYMRTREEGRAFFQRIVNAPADTDIVTIFGSGNDCGHTFDDYGLGSITDTGTDTICGCINTTIDTIQERMPMVRLGIITPTPWEKWPPYDGENKMAQYSRAIVEICKARSIPCLDLYHCSNLRPWDEDFRALAYSRDDGSGVHPDENGHAMLAPRIKAFLDTLIL